MMLKEETLLRKKQSKIINIQQLEETVKYVIEDNKDRNRVNIYTCKDGEVVSVEDVEKDNVVKDAMLNDSVKILNRLSIYSFILLLVYIAYNRETILILKPIQCILLGAIVASTLGAMIWNKITGITSIKDLRFQIYMKLLFKSSMLLLILPAIASGIVGLPTIIAYLIVYYFYNANNIVSIAKALGLNE